METGFLTPLFDRPGPWASVYLDTTRATQDAAKQQELRNRSVLAQLDEAGADPYTREALAKRLDAEPVSGAPPGRALFAAGAEVVLDLPLTSVPPASEATWRTLPHIAPLAGLYADDPPCLVARIDTTGADLELFGAQGREPLGSVEGTEWRARGHRSIPADRYEWHYRNKVEQGWEQTAEIIASTLARHWPHTGAQLALLAGEARERRAVLQRLPEQLRNVTVEAAGGSRQSHAAGNLLEREVTRARAAHTRRHLEDAVDTFRAARGRPGERTPEGVLGPGQAAEGVPAVVEAARSHQLATLLLAEDGPDMGREVWIGPGGDDIAVRRSEARSAGVANPQSARADDALVRAAAACDADVLRIPDGMAGPAGGCGAVLRWTVSRREPA
ncbi:hypothetical protein [Streptomyces sp. JJ36]|uniref:baeRF2 domain-containing protein n=1 Tax=Streptomyces sp. JJ36 TaxID=2736645 RepID=UPI001F2CC59B|nr:hypothetical protein [Streptomyces sp. JJ36]MCF6524586.1 hypothetical protein [Streptomyces sp. JJ36]